MVIISPKTNLNYELMHFKHDTKIKQRKNAQETASCITMCFCLIRKKSLHFTHLKGANVTGNLK